jgi:hypothetical protein
MPYDPNDEHEPSVRRLTRDLANAAATMTAIEARYLVDAYYISQEDRKRAHNQVRSMTKEPHVLISWLAEQGETLESQIKRALDKYTDAHVPGVWAKSVYGIGPVISAGMLAHIDIKNSPTVGHVYSFAGIAGSGQKPWNKGEKRPYNAELKTLCWKTGQCFMKFHNEDACTYGKIYEARKAYEEKRNLHDNAELAAQILATKKFDKKTEAYQHLSQGHLPPGQIDARARRYAVKLFLSHMHAVMHWVEFQRLPPNPYAIDHLGHTHFKVMPNAELVAGLPEALRERGLLH